MAGFGSLALAGNEPARSACLLAAAEKLHETIGAPMPLFDRTHFDHEVARVRALLQEEAFTMAWNEGRNMSVEQAASCALQ